jgi:hypothetical protein
MNTTSLPKTRREALDLGLKHFFPARECKRGHVCAHRVDNGCMECAVLRKRQWRAENPEESTRRVTEYVKANREKVNAWRRENHNTRRGVDLDFSLKLRLRRRMNGALLAADATASASTMKLLGCKPSELRAHLEAQFSDGMGWDNYGEWEVDHIRPCASFDLTDPVQQRKCFHYGNLQPLWKSVNRSKGAKLVA